MKQDIASLFCFVDHFMPGIQEDIKRHALEPSQQTKKPTRFPSRHESEIITILLLFQRSPCHNFKYFYNSYLKLDTSNNLLFLIFISLKPADSLEHIFS